MERDDQPRDRAQQPEPELPPEPGDFADEHASTTFADEQPGGPEGEKETESPEGYAGLESRGVARRRGENG